MGASEIVYPYFLMIVCKNGFNAIQFLLYAMVFLITFNKLKISPVTKSISMSEGFKKRPPVKNGRYIQKCRGLGLMFYRILSAELMPNSDKILNCFRPPSHSYFKYLRAYGFDLFSVKVLKNLFFLGL
jgi:hypothetical protein